MKIAHTPGSHPDNPIRLGSGGGTVPGPDQAQQLCAGYVITGPPAAVTVQRALGPRVLTAEEFRQLRAAVAELRNRTTQEQDNNARRTKRCWRCNRGDNPPEWHAAIEVPEEPLGQQIVGRRDTWQQAMDVARGWTGPGQRAYVHRAVQPLGESGA